ncbi:polysaccharide lyase beta-sandwich domain-containing protein [Vibrio taketomensis]|uniref:polysaccharide lyase beta-sandwich domain-containing protein n=1 Tax=Vibrio taketomensis TaxID=2572923 RepID=UPI0018D7F552|nr:polysaccharide lyase beta-sandwich domain-containing protein [Vibrio taketomensis]
MPVKVVANTESVHAVEHIDLGIFAANFFDSAKAGEIEASNISIMTQEKNDLVTISVSNPTRSWFDSDFTIDGQFEIAQDKQNRVSIDDNQVSVELSDLNGSSYTFQLKRIK